MQHTARAASREDKFPLFVLYRKLRPMEQKNGTRKKPAAILLKDHGYYAEKVSMVFLFCICVTVQP